VVAWLGFEADVAAAPSESVAISDALTVDAGATCLEHDRLSEQIVGWLGSDEIDPRLAIHVEGDANDERSLRFTLHDRDEALSERVFRPGPSRCDDLHAVVALAIAMAVDATVVESVVPEPEPEPPPELKPQPEPKPLPESEVSAVPPEPLDLKPRTPAWELRGHLRGVLAYGAPPDVGGGAQLGLELGWNDLVDLQLGVMATSAGARPVDGATLAVTLVAARADGCVGPRLGQIRPRACLGMLAGSALGEGRGFQRDYRAHLPWLAAALGADVRVALVPRVRLWFGLEGLATVVRPVFDLREESEVRTLRELPRFGAIFGVGLVVVLR